MQDSGKHGDSPVLNVFAVLVFWSGGEQTVCFCSVSITHSASLYGLSLEASACSIVSGGGRGIGNMSAWGFADAAKLFWAILLAVICCQMT